jgi:predicted GNAT superfamily acetyltransferase
MQMRKLRSQDIPSIWEINEQGLPGTGKVSQQEVVELLRIAELTIGAFDGEKLLGFVLCFLPRTDYASLNYAWFNQRYQDFLYVDRIAVSENQRNRTIGSLLYQEVISYAKQYNYPIAAEVSLNPPNPGSMRFHQRFDFAEIGILNHQSKSVTMMMRDC